MDPPRGVRYELIKDLSKHLEALQPPRKCASRVCGEHRGRVEKEPVRGVLIVTPFRERFEAKGRFEEFLSKVPTFLVLEESPALLGLANVPLDD